MFDSGTCAAIMKRSSEPLLQRLQQVALADVCMSVIARAELLYGVEVSADRARDAAALAAFLPYIATVEFSNDAELHYAEIRADLRRRRLKLGSNDLLIAAHARSLGLTLVTSKVAEFVRVEDLALENWTVPASRQR